ncbi:hemolysin family protein [Mesobacillus selenatarsenatis]|uniref:Hemolysins and related proteins containing CBS domains n=1 Tax=Mesobacillus selenatarsenatis (strain DSM 18680 / JCM 14380 / FERM P-15431 / SF-1) TaxID=1321606 RepID=A0A0A8X8Z1_MESS1|nr:hemolysin family protein [Mesobacillus selenatarsenatis]GAM15487.1 hemolysins and related proteins containing CBS domains [Mesobacillus selenatarsenatis SF-1]
MEVPIGLVILLGVLILLSAFFSSAETAFSSVNKIRLRNYVSEGRAGSKNALHISENFDDALSTILVGNNIVNIAAASISSKVAVDLFGASTGLIVSTFGMTILILIFGEILPKSMAKENAEEYSLKISAILLLLIKILTPVNFVFSKLKASVSRMFSKGENQPSVTEEEIKVMVDISEEEGVINNEERELVHRSLEFNDVLVGEVLTHRMDMITIEVNQSLEEIKQIFIEERFSRVPVYEDNIDNIIGFLSEREFFAELIQNKEVNVREMLRQPMFVVKSMKIATLLPELQRTKSHMAIVVDEFGGTSGLITLEDILEELVGEIWDEHDEKVNIMTKIDESTYEFDAAYDLDDFAELFNVPMPETSYHNLGGWIFETFESIPVNGDTFVYETLRIIVKEVENHRIRKIKVEIMPVLEVEE